MPTVLCESLYFVINYRHITFHLITKLPPAGSKSLSMPQLFESACALLGVKFKLHDMAKLDLADVEALGAKDMVYRSVIGSKAARAEKLMMTAECASFYVNWTSVFGSRSCSYFLHEKIGIPVIASVPFIPDTTDGIRKAVEQLGDFPIVVKVLGGSHGVGVIRVDSLPSLTSLLDYLRSINANVLLRKYIEHDYYSRLVVVGDRVVASHITNALSDEFRTNAGDLERTREPKVFSQEIQDIAVKAVHSLGLETGGVDLLFDTSGQPHLAEVNFPNDFTFTQRITGIDIAQEMVKHLMSKVASKSA